MFKKLHIAWENGPKNVKEEFDRFSNIFLPKENNSMKIKSKNNAEDFISNDDFIAHNISEINSENTLEKIDVIMTYCDNLCYNIDMNFLELCDDLLSAKLYLYIQMLLIEIVYTNHNIDIILSEKSTNYLFTKLSKKFNISKGELISIILSMVKKMSSNNKKSVGQCICFSRMYDNILQIVIDDKQTLSRHSIKY